MKVTDKEMATGGLGALQLEGIAEVHDRLEKEGIPYWLFGGWAVDFYAGKITRDHDDIDMAVWRDDHPSISEHLTRDGWRRAPIDDEQAGAAYERETVRLELTFLVRDDEGRVYIPLSHGRAYWSEEGFGDDVRELLGVRARLISLEQLAGGKSSPREDPEDADKDRADFAVLGRLANETGVE
jgi:Aminoglycoside-2''-adenylyltransferase